MGPKKALSPRVIAAYIPGLNHPMTLEDVRRTSEKQLHLRLSCGRHITLKSSYAVHRNPKALECDRCDPSNKGRFTDGASQHEKAAWQAMRHVPYEWYVEVRALRGMYGAADIWVPLGATLSTYLSLVIMIDGEAHFNDVDAASGTSIEAQQQRDQDFNDRCWVLNYRLLRLHYKDRASFQQLIQTALRRCIEEPYIRFWMFSSSFTKQGKAEPFGPRHVDTPGLQNHTRK